MSGPQLDARLRLLAQDESARILADAARNIRTLANEMGHAGQATQQHMRRSKESMISNSEVSLLSGKEESDANRDEGETIASGRRSRPMISSCDRTTARSTTFSSSRTLPGQW